MKIFSWVHRRFNNKENANKYGDVSKFPAEHKCGDDGAYERWGGGILAIGTFGYDPLKKDENEHKYNINDYFSSSSSEDDDDGDGGSDAGGEENDDEEVVAAEMEESWSDEEVQVQLGYEYMMMKKTERTTLADLFSADCKEKRGPVSKKEAAAAVEKPAAADVVVKGKSNRKSFGNKLIAKDAPRPIQKLNKLMRRMLKRKIHPDVGPATSKVAAAVNTNNINISNKNSNNNSRATNDYDYASLLPTTDTNI